MKCCACSSGFVEPEQNGYDGTCQNKRCKLRQKLKHTTTEWYIKFFVQLYDKNQQKVYLSCYNEVVDKVCHVLHIKHQDLTTSELTDGILKYGDHYFITYDVIQKKIIDFSLTFFVNILGINSGYIMHVHHYHPYLVSKY